VIKSISYWSLEHGLANTHLIADALQEARDAGFRGLELGIGPEGVITPHMPRDACEQIRKQIDASGLTVQTLASGMSWGFNPTSEDPDVRQQAIDLHAGALERAAWLGCDALLMVPGVVVSPIAPDQIVRYDLALERVRDAVSRLLETADRVGVDLCLENVWNGLFYSPIELREFIDSYQSDRLGVYYDCGNLVGIHQHPPHWIELLGERIKRVHVKDFRDTFGFEGSYSFCELLEGDVPWEATMAALRRIGYDRTLVAEMLPWSEGLLERTSAAMDKILAMG